MLEKFFEEIKKYKENKFDREEYLSRIKALPKDYQTVYNGMAEYMWSSGVGGSGVMDSLLDILSLFEDGAKNGRKVLDITGEDVIGFSDNILRELSGKTWIGKMKADKNKAILGKLEK